MEFVEVHSSLMLLPYQVKHDSYTETLGWADERILKNLQIDRNFVRMGSSWWSLEAIKPSRVSPDILLQRGK